MVCEKKPGQGSPDGDGFVWNSRAHTEHLAERFLSFGSCVSDNNSFRKAKKLIAEHGIPLPSVTIEYRGLEATTEASIGTGGVVTLVSVPVNLFKKYVLRKHKTTELKLLHNINGKLNPGRLTLLLGPPSCGKSTYLKCLSGYLMPSVRLGGTVKFNGKTTDQFFLKSSAAYVSQYDNHNPNLTVRETLEFAYICQNGVLPTRAPCPFDIPAAKISDPEEAEFVQLVKDAWGTRVRIDIVLRALGLSHCADTPVGDALFRGISGGERKRLTSGEYLVGPRSILMMDEISTGLDSATLYNVIGWLAEATRTLQLTTVVSLLQPPPEVFFLFDDVLLMALGRNIYHGPVKDVIPHFDSLGLVRPHRKDVPSFLLEITTAKGQRSYADDALRDRCQSLLSADATLSLNGTTTAALDDAIRAVISGQAEMTPQQSAQVSQAIQGERRLLINNDELRSLFETQNVHGQKMMYELDHQPFDVQRGHPEALAQREELMSPRETVRQVTRRQITLVMRDGVLLKGRIMQVIVISLLTSSLFYKLGTSLITARTFFGASFMSVLFISFGGFPQIPITLEAKKVFFKHRNSGFYNATSQGLAMALSQLPLSVIEATLFSLIMYFMVGFVRGAGYFFIFFLTCVLTSLSLSSAFRMNACLYPDMVMANALTGLLMVILVISSGFAIVHKAIPGWMIWAYWISPWAYGLRNLVINEMTSPRWTNLPGPNVGDKNLGFAALESFDFYTSRSWIWIGVGFLILSYIVTTIVSILALKFLNPPTIEATVPDEKATLKARLEANERRRGIALRQETQAINTGATKDVSGILSEKLGNTRVQKGGGVRNVNPTAVYPLPVGGSEGGGGKALGEGVEEEKGVGDIKEVKQILAPTPSDVELAKNRSSGLSPFAQEASNAAPSSAKSPTGVSFADGDNNDSSSSSPDGQVLDVEAHRKYSLNHNAHHMPRINTGLPALPASVPDSSRSIISSLAFQPVTLVFKDLWYTVPNPGFSKGAVKQLHAYEAALAAAGGGGGADVETGAFKAGVGEEGKEVGAEKEKEKEKGQGGAGGKGGANASAVNDKITAMPPEELAALRRAAKPELDLLQGITGFSEPGVLVALMGGSGAGKTTFMDVVAGRKTIGKIRGDIIVNGHPVNQASWSRVVGYVEQQDIHTPSATVIESLQTSARLRLPPSISNEDIRIYLDEVVDIIDLMDIMVNVVGSPGLSGLSTEQRKRLTIGVELVANPSVVFMDEPTSGLDARAAVLVMNAVRNVALNGRTVMVTIHQPSIEIFEAFDMLFLIQKGGKITYFGNLGTHSQNLVGYLSSFPNVPDVPMGYNPATWMLEVTGGSTAITVTLASGPVDWPARYNASQLCQENEAYVRTLLEELPKEFPNPLDVGSIYAMPFNVQFHVLLDKFIKQYWRTPSYNLMRLTQTLIVSFIYGATYYKQGVIHSPAQMSDVQNVMGVMFSSSNFLGMTNLMSIMPLVGYERIVFYRERAASMYDPFAYGFAMAIVEIPYLLIQSTLFVPIVYFLCAFESSAEKFWYYYIVFFETIAFYTIFGQFLVYCTPAMTIGQVVAATFNFLFNIFNGFIITYPDFPNGWRWMNRIAPPTWILYGLGVSQLGDRMDPLYYNGKAYTIKSFMEERFGYKVGLRWWIILILAAYILFFRVTSIFALRYWNFLKR